MSGNQVLLELLKAFKRYKLNSTAGALKYSQILRNTLCPTKIWSGAIHVFLHIDIMHQHDLSERVDTSWDEKILPFSVTITKLGLAAYYI